MAVARIILTQFNAGEFSPLLEGRVDIEGYAASARLLENLMPTPWGPALMRPGTRHIAEVADSDDEGGLLGFQYSTLQAYMVEAGDAYFRFYADRARLVVAETDGTISNGTFPSGITDWDDRSTGGAGNQISHDATNDRLSLEVSGTAADDIGWAEQDVTISAGFQNVEHVLAFDVIGAAGDQVEIQIGTTTTGAEILGPVVRRVGHHVVQFTPGATTFYVQFRNRGNFREKTVQIDNVSLLSDQALELVTPYAAADVQGLRADQSADVLFVEHPDYAARRLERYDSATWSLVEVAFEDGPYLAENTTGTTLTPGAATGFGVTMTASATRGINDDEGFKATDIGRLIRLQEGSTWGWCVIVGHTSSTVVTVDIRSTLTNTNAKTVWRLGLYCDTLGHARHGSFHEQRRVLSGAGGGTDRNDISATDDYPNFQPGTDDDDAFTAKVIAGEANAVVWTVSARTLLVGTLGTMADQRPAIVRSGGTFRIGPANASAALSPGNVQAAPETVRVLAIELGRKRLTELAYDFGEDGFVPVDMSIRAEHIGEKKLSRPVFHRTPWSVCWTLLDDGTLAAFAYEPSNKVQGWARHILGGSFSGGQAVVEDVAVINGADGEEAWLLVKRTIDGATKRYIEVLESRLTEETDQEDAFYVDSGLTYDGASTTTITGLDHLEGEEVAVLADGAIQASKTVASGAITIDEAASVVQVGLAYTWQLKPQRIEAGARLGTAQGVIRQISELKALLWRSGPLQAGPDSDSLRQYTIDPDTFDTAPTLKSGYVELPFDAVADAEGTLLLTGTSPMPVNIVALVLRVDTEEE